MPIQRRDGKTKYKVGEFAAHVFGLPGPDITYIRIDKIEDGVVYGFDLIFKFDRSFEMCDSWTVPITFEELPDWLKIWDNPSLKITVQSTT